METHKDLRSPEGHQVRGSRKDWPGLEHPAVGEGEFRDDEEAADQRKEELRYPVEEEELARFHELAIGLNNCIVGKQNGSTTASACPARSVPGDK